MNKFSQSFSLNRDSSHVSTRRVSVGSSLRTSNYLSGFCIPSLSPAHRSAEFRQDFGVQFGKSYPEPVEGLTDRAVPFGLRREASTVSAQPNRAQSNAELTTEA